MSLPLVILLLLAVLLLIVLLTSLATTSKVKRKVNYMLDALEDSETNFRFGRGNFFNRNLNSTLNRLRDIFDKETKHIRESESYYARMLDNVSTGVVVVERSTGRVLYSNRMARSLLGLATLNSLRQLSVIDKDVYEAFDSVEEGADRKASFYSESTQRRIAISASLDHIDGKDVKIIVFNDISSALEETESESWTRLIRVLTHEIMNTVTPIASLSEALKEVQGDELKAGLETISSSSRSLIRFVESYRNLTRVAAPVRKAFYVRDLAAKVLELNDGFLREHSASASFEEKQSDILLYADEGQISQILINLIKNAVQAGASRVSITADIDGSDCVVVNVANNGRPISPESQSQIFVPFFTTKQEGTGIGLSLSRQIMRLHGGNLRLLRSDEEATVFSLIFR